MNKVNNLTQEYYPDILNTLSNLSNDEVFTPPEIVNKMLDLLPLSIWNDKSIKFLDPVTKSGVFLREIAKRLIIGLEDEFPILEERLDHIFKNQLYGIAITELTSLLSRRSVYCSKFPNSRYSVVQTNDISGNIRFKKTNHTWVGKKCIYCNAPKSGYNRLENLETFAYEFIHTNKVKELFNMKFDVIIGNPPYQLSDGGAQASAVPIYQKFIQQSMKLNPRYLCMITPSRWFSGGKGLDDFREQMLNDRRIRVIHDFLNASDCFPGVDIKGGVNYFLWDRDNEGPCEVSTHVDNKIISVLERYLLEPGCDIFIRYNESIEILRKIQAFNEDSFSSLVQSAMIFGFRTFFKDFDSVEYRSNYIKVYANKSIGFIRPERLVKSRELVSKWKVIIPEAVGSGNMLTDILKPILSEPYSINTETYIMNGPYMSEIEARNVISYINTRFFHFLLGLKKITQHTTQNVYQFIPIQDFSIEWNDAKLFNKYKLSNEEIEYIVKNTPNIGNYNE